MRILQVITSLEMGGAETLVVNLIPRLQALGNTVDLCVFDGKETPLTQRLREESPQTKIFALGHGVYNPLYIIKLAKIMKNYDIVHTHNSSPQLFVAIASLFSQTHLVSTEHNTSNRKRNWKWYRPIESWMYGRYDHVICISKIAEEKLREYMGGEWLVKSSNKYESITTINNGIDVNAISKATPCKELLDLKESRKSILMVAGFRKQKNQDTIIRALTLLDKEKYEVWFAGIGERMEEVKQLAFSLGVSDRVRFLGLRTDIPNVLRAADVIVMSSHWEGLSLSNVEGMSAHKPFIASDVNGLKEVTKGYGLLFPHEDAKALAEEIEHLASDEAYYNEIAERCYNRALEFDISNTVSGYVDVYKNIFN
ncbi:glycosyltransferase family 4 protein [Prevotella histicola]|jgi:glycosyltransferase, group 1 family protein|uniref:glycosyltransferase family 4 protein n=1 Tax=Prevotella histicola TaxID=470565 RepID=UPI0024200C25|nr:glycosyltransferase family 4 protein [Prevotella histicola]MBS5898623.1 glycosyltransferase family 4 protein [Prevotella histicola]